MKNIFTSRYDLAGSEIFRITRTLAFNRCIPVGNLAGGGGIRCLLVLIVLHVLGRPVFGVLMRQERRAHALHTFINRLKK